MRLRTSTTKNSEKKIYLGVGNPKYIFENKSSEKYFRHFLFFFNFSFTLFSYVVHIYVGPTYHSNYIHNILKIHKKTNAYNNIKRTICIIYIMLQFPEPNVYLSIFIFRILDAMIFFLFIY